MYEIVITPEKFKDHTTHTTLISTTLHVFGLCYFYFFSLAVRGWIFMYSFKLLHEIFPSGFKDTLVMVTGFDRVGTI